MPRNIEIKARVEDMLRLQTLVAGLSDNGPYYLEQDDHYFCCSTGILKLRIESVKGELIFYQREKQSGPKESSYLRYPVENPKPLIDLLNEAFGTLGQVKKKRMVYLCGRTRIHLDAVEGLGNFLELEVVMGEKELAPAAKEEAKSLMKNLGINEKGLVQESYLELLKIPNAS